MRKLILAAVAATLVAPAATFVPTTAADAKTYKHRSHSRHQYREWRGHDGRTYCRKPDGTTGLVVGGVAGALVGRTVDTRGDRTAGTVLGAVAGAVAGRAIERGGSHCR